MTTLKSLIKTLFAPIVAFITAIVSPDEVISMMASITGIFTLVPFIVEPIKNWLNTEGWATKLGVVLPVSLVLTHASWWLSYGFDEYTIIHTLLISAGITVASWGYFSIEQVKAALNFLFEYLKK
jgi:hypothetical protein